MSSFIIKQIQPTQILAPPQPVALPTISTLPEEDEPEPEQQEPEPEQQAPEPDQHEPEQEQHEPAPDQQEPEPEQQSELLSQGVPRDLYHYGKAPSYIESLLA